MRAAAATAILFLLAACNGSGPAPLPALRVGASFPRGGIANVIVVNAVERLALESAKLVAPDGKATAATSIDVVQSPSLGSQRLLGSALFAGEAFGAASNPRRFSPAPLGGAPNASARLLATVSTASIPVPDPIAYRRDWRKYRIELRFGIPPGTIERRDIAAPMPAPAS